MSGFALSEGAIDVAALRAALQLASTGGIVTFEGVVRDHNEGRAVQRLAYQAYGELATREGARVLEDALARFAIERVSCVHRTGTLALGELAVWIGVAAKHRAAAFDACRFVIDELKQRVPIWKKEFYADGESEWLHP